MAQKVKKDDIPKRYQQNISISLSTLSRMPSSKQSNSVHNTIHFMIDISDIIKYTSKKLAFDVMHQEMSSSTIVRVPL